MLQNRYLGIHSIVAMLVIIVHDYLFLGFIYKWEYIAFTVVILHWVFIPKYVPDISRTFREIRFFLIQTSIMVLAIFGPGIAKHNGINIDASQTLVTAAQFFIICLTLLHWQFHYIISWWKHYPSFLKTIDKSEQERILVLNELKRIDEERSASYSSLFESAIDEETSQGEYEKYSLSYRETIQELVELQEKVDTCMGFYTENEKNYWLGYISLQIGIGCSRLRDAEHAEKFLTNSLVLLTQFEAEVPYGNTTFREIAETVCIDGYIAAIQVVPSIASVVGEDGNREDDEMKWYESLITDYIPAYPDFPYIQSGAYRKAAQYFISVDSDKARKYLRDGINVLEGFTSLEESIKNGSTILLEMKDLLANVLNDDSAERINHEIEPYQHLNTWRLTNKL